MTKLSDNKKSVTISHGDFNFSNKSNTFPFIALSTLDRSYSLWATVEVISQSVIKSKGELYGHNIAFTRKTEEISNVFRKK